MLRFKRLCFQSGQWKILAAMSLQLAMSLLLVGCNRESSEEAKPAISQNRVQAPPGAAEIEAGRQNTVASIQNNNNIPDKQKKAIMEQLRR